MTNARREEKNEDAKFDDADSIGIKLMLLLLPLELAAAPLDARRARAASAEALESQRLDIDVRGKARSAEEERALLFRFFFPSPFSVEEVACSLSPLSRSKHSILQKAKSFGPNSLLCALRRRHRHPSGRRCDLLDLLDACQQLGVRRASDLTGRGGNEISLIVVAARRSSWCQA